MRPSPGTFPCGVLGSFPAIVLAGTGFAARRPQPGTPDSARGCLRLALTGIGSGNPRARSAALAKPRGAPLQTHVLHTRTFPRGATSPASLFPLAFGDETRISVSRLSARMPRPIGNDVTLGEVVGTGQPLVFPRESRDKHLYVAGVTGTGKSKFLESLVRQEHSGDGSRAGAGCSSSIRHGSLYDFGHGMARERQRTRLPIIPIDLRQERMGDLVQRDPQADGLRLLGGDRQLRRGRSRTSGALRGRTARPRFDRWGHERPPDPVR